MRYTGTIYKGVIVAKGINYTDFIDKNEIELTEYQYNTISIPCEVVDGEFVSCDFPTEDVVGTPTEETPNTETATKADVAAVWDSMAVAYNEGVNAV